MPPELTDYNPIACFVATKLDESVLLDLRILANAIYMTIDYAGESFDWSENKTLRVGDLADHLPKRDFRLLLFENPNRVCLKVDHECLSSKPEDFSIRWRPGPTVLYSVRCQGSGTGIFFECMSNKFERLSFGFEAIKSSMCLAESILIGGNWVYRKVVDGAIVDIRNPFKLDDIIPGKEKGM